MAELTPDMLAVLTQGTATAGQVQKLLAEEEKLKPIQYIVKLYKRFNFVEFYLKKTKKFDDIEDAKQFIRYVSFEQYKSYDKAEIIDNKGKKHLEMLI